MSEVKVKGGMPPFGQCGHSFYTLLFSGVRCHRPLGWQTHGAASLYAFEPR